MTPDQLMLLNKYFTNVTDIDDFVISMRKLNHVIVAIILETDALDHYKDVVSKGYNELNAFIETLDPYLSKTA